MNSATTSPILENFTLGILFLAISVIFCWVGYLQKYFELPAKDEAGPNVRLRHVFSVFLIFLLLYIILGPFIMRLFFQFPYLIEHANTATALLQLLVFFLAIGFLLLYSAFQEKRAMLGIWKQADFSQKKSISKDVGLGLFSWIISIPVVITVGQLALVLTLLLFGPTEQEQTAVRYMKEALDTPFSLTVALFSILIAAPFIEEFLFRGFLLSYLRNKFGSWNAIFFSSILFALFHYAPSQSSTNIPLILSLFAFALFLGFSYEKSRSLWTSIVLHVTFNTASVIRIIFTT